MDNGSTDGSLDVFASLLDARACPQIRLVRVAVNQGYGYGILAGLKEADGELLGWTHADMQTDPADVLEAIHLFRESETVDALFVKGERQHRGLLDAGFTFGMSVVSWFALGMWLKDINAQPKVFSRQFYESMQNPPQDFSLDLYVLYLAKQRKMKVATIPVVFAKRLHGEAKGGGSLKTKIPLVKRTFAYIFALRKDLRCAKS